MALNQPISSSRFPYLPLRLEVRGRSHDLEALLDTGFDGYVAVPPGRVGEDRHADGYLPCQLADGSEVLAPLFRGTVRVGEMAPFPILVIALGDEPLVGRGVSDRFRVILDHGQRLIVES